MMGCDLARVLIDCSFVSTENVTRMDVQDKQDRDWRGCGKVSGTSAKERETRCLYFRIGAVG